jgi:hypothetical protein
VAVHSDITFIVSYRCPRCGVALEARTGRSTSWLKCPKCKRASQPPEHVSRPVIRDVFTPSDDVLVITDNPYATATAAPRVESRPYVSRPDITPPAMARPAAPIAPVSPNPVDPYAGNEPVSLRRVVLTTLLFISVMMLLFSYLSQNPLGISIASASSLICLILLVVPTRSS